MKLGHYWQLSLVQRSRGTFTLLKLPATKYVKECLEEVAKASKLLKLLLNLGIGGYCDCWTMLFGSRKSCYDSQWLLTGHYFKHCN